jgi:signal peptidase II
VKKFYNLFFIIVTLDQLTKLLVTYNMPYGARIPILGNGQGLFNLIYVENTGMAFSAFTGYNTLLLIFACLVVVCVAVWAIRAKNKLTKLQIAALTLIVSGGTGNIIDRIFRGAVVDFLDFGVRSARWPAFNVADSAVCVGAAFLIISILFEKGAKSL